MEESVKLRRITYKLKCPNPLFTKWVQEWKEEAEKNNLKSKHVFAEALESLKKFPLPLESGQDCAILHGFGKTLCSLLDDKLEEYNKMKGRSMSSEGSIDLEAMEQLTRLPNFEPPVTDHLVANGEVFKGVYFDSIPESRNSNIELAEKKTVKQKNVNCMNGKLYAPSYRSGPYAILVTLMKSLNNKITYLSKQEIQTAAQCFCDKSFTQPETGSRYTAWSSMSTLITKGLVSKSGNPPKFSLTDEGIQVAEQLFEKYVDLKINENNSTTTQDITELQNDVQEVFNKNSQKSPEKTSEFDVVIFPSNTFETILLVDTQETSGFAKTAYDETIHELNQCNVKFEIRRLNVGDFTWICRDESKRELILPYIVERKRMDDFGSSIRDGRFREQKFRLKHCGVQNLLYLIESYGRNEHTGLPLSTLMQAACNTSVQDGFTIKFTNTHRDSIMYLALMTRLLKDNISGKTLVSCPKENLKKFTFDDDIIALMNFSEFQNISIKTKHYTVQNMFIKQLIQIKGVSIDKAIGIVTRYPTPLCLYKAYKENPVKVKEKLLANVPFGPLRKNIGPSISEIIYQLFTLDKY